MINKFFETARTYRAIIEEAVVSVDDKTASKAVVLHGTLKEDGSLIKSGTRLNWKGRLVRAAVDLWDTKENNPDNAPDLWEDILYRDGHRIIPEVITVGTAFGLDEYGWWGDVLMQSTMNDNVYTPDQYPAGWRTVEVN